MRARHVPCKHECVSAPDERSGPRRDDSRTPLRRTASALICSRVGALLQRVTKQLAEFERLALHWSFAAWPISTGKAKGCP